MLKLFDNFWRIFFQIFKKESNFGPVMSVTFAPGLTSLQGYLSDKNPNDTGAESRYCSNFTQILTLSLCALIPDSNWLKLHDLFWLEKAEILRFFWDSVSSDPFIARGYGSPQWMGGFEALDGIFVYSIAGNSETEEPPVSYHFDHIKRFDVIAEK